MKIPQTTTVFLDWAMEGVSVHFLAKWQHKEFERINGFPVEDLADHLALEVEDRMIPGEGWEEWPSRREGLFQMFMYMVTPPNSSGLGYGGYVAEALDYFEEHDNVELRVSSDKLLIVMQELYLKFYPPETKRGPAIVKGAYESDFEDTV